MDNEPSNEINKQTDDERFSFCIMKGNEGIIISKKQAGTRTSIKRRMPHTHKKRPARHQIWRPNEIMKQNKQFDLFEKDDE
jgi:hypothetical protein